MIFFSGDWRFFWQENILEFAHFPSSWDSILNTGIGKQALESGWITSYLNLTALWAWLGLSWEVISLVFWILPAIVISFISGFCFFRYLIPVKNKTYAFLSGFIYAFNTYFLMIFLGGQMGIALSYSLAPFVLLCFLKIFDRFRPFSKDELDIKSKSLNFFRTSIIAGIALALQVLFDPRISFVLLIIIGLYLVYRIFTLLRERKHAEKALSTKARINDDIVCSFSEVGYASKGFAQRSVWGSTRNASDFIYFLSFIFYLFVVPLLIVFLLHLYWILPLLLFRESSLFDSLTTWDIGFFSFASLENSISLLHPNWPENIFGKVYFMRPQFLVLPLIAFTSLFFAKKNNVFFVLLAIFGAFLAKGANPPFAEIYSWLFKNAPGFSLFRDPTKFYIMVAISYSLLIPYSLFSVADWFDKRLKNNGFLYFISQRFGFLFAIFYLFLILSPFWQRGIQNGFKPKQVPQEYIKLKDFLVGQDEFFRTFWIPQWQRFGYFSYNHPAIGRGEIIEQEDPLEMVDELSKEGVEKTLRNLGVKYIIIPYDSESELFLNDRKYDDEKYKQTVEKLRKIVWLKEVESFGKVTVFETGNWKDRFFLDQQEQAEIKYRFVSSTKYQVEVIDGKKGDTLVFSERHGKGWSAVVDGMKIFSRPYSDNLNSFVLPKDGNYDIEISYQPQKWLMVGFAISFISLLLISSYFIGFCKNTRSENA